MPSHKGSSLPHGKPNTRRGPFVTLWHVTRKRFRGRSCRKVLARKGPCFFLLRPQRAIPQIKLSPPPPGKPNNIPPHFSTPWTHLLAPEAREIATTLTAPLIKPPMKRAREKRLLEICTWDAPRNTTNCLRFLLHIDRKPCARLPQSHRHKVCRKRNYSRKY